MSLCTAKTGCSDGTPCEAYHLGIVEHARACQLQEDLARARRAGELPDIILTLEHYPVLAIGRSGYKPEHLLVTKDTLDREGISMCHVNRGGGITYHGPGQLVCYPIFDLKSKELTVRQYIRYLEEVIIASLAQLRIGAWRSPSASGVWVDGGEVSSIGIHVSHGITKHGFAMNIRGELGRFGYIAPCGVAGKKVTSVTQVSGIELAVEDCIPAVIQSFGRVFALDICRKQSRLLKGYHE